MALPGWATLFLRQGSGTYQKEKDNGPSARKQAGAEFHGAAGPVLAKLAAERFVQEMGRRQPLTRPARCPIMNASIGSAS